ncbi:MAG: hypothetical protein V1492_06420 [Candidatus Micrarchaeota archaeon]
MSEIERDLRMKTIVLNMVDKEKRGGSVETFKVLELERTTPKNIKSCFYVRGERLRQILDELISDICKKRKMKKHDLCKELTSELGCDETTIEKFIYNKNYFPVYLIRILLRKISKRRVYPYSVKIQKNVDLFKSGSRGKWAKFPKRLDREIAWLCGAIAADGCISREKGGKERITIVDQNISALEIARKNFEKIFYVNTPIKRSKTLDCSLLIVDCKAISKFFTTFLGFNYGRKIETVCEPDIIKKSHYRLDFARGVMTFDGSVELDCTASLGVKSLRLIQDLYDILRENGFEFNYSRTNPNLFYIRSPHLSRHKDSKKWISLFGLNTTKGNRLDFLINGAGKKVDSEEEALRALEIFVRKKPTSSVSITDVFNFAKENQRFTKHQLMEKFKIAHATFWKYVLVLRKANILYCEGKIGGGKPYYYSFNPRLERWNVPITVS